MQQTAPFTCSRGFFMSHYTDMYTQGGDSHCKEGVLHFTQIPTGFELLSQSLLCRSPVLPQLLISLVPSLPCALPPCLEASAPRSPSTHLTAKGSNLHLDEKVAFPLLNASRNDVIQDDSLSIHPSFKL